MRILFALLLLAADPYIAEIAKWRAEREANLQTDTGWLTVVGLHWLEQGANTVGSAPGSAVVLPGSTPASVGVITLRGKQAEFVATPGVDVRSKGRRVDRVALDQETQLEIASVSFFIIERVSRIGVRVRDRDAATRRNFRGLQWYATDPRWRVRARLVPPAPGRTVRIGNIVGDASEYESAGELAFEIGGRELRLEGVWDSPEREEIFLMFKDRTSAKTTYGAGRYMYVPRAVDGAVDLDFNKAYNPPCAFTAYATCPLPPRQNTLPVAVEAGEKSYEAH